MCVHPLANFFTTLLCRPVKVNKVRKYKYQKMNLKPAHSTIIYRYYIYFNQYLTLLV